MAPLWYGFFDEFGLVEETNVVSSTNDSMAAAVKSAVSQWKITPVSVAGKPTKFVVRQPFRFQAAWVTATTPDKGADPAARGASQRNVRRN